MKAEIFVVILIASIWTISIEKAWNFKIKKSHKDAACTTGSGNCKKCKSDNTACEECLPGYAVKDGTVVCAACDANCKTCINAATLDKCASCDTTGAKPWFDEADKKCLDKCPNNRALDNTNKICKKCTPTTGECKICLTTDLTKCTDCVENKAVSSGKCVDTCTNAGCNDNTKGKCATTDANKCTKCNDNPTKLANTKGECIDSCTTNCKICESSRKCKECADGYKLDTYLGTCGVCDTNCATCEDSDSKKCKSCANDKYLDKDAKKCMTKCNSNCLECWDGTKGENSDWKHCTKCGTGNYKYLDTEKNKCMEVCSKDSYCKTCESDDWKKCTNESCIDGTYYDASTQKCKPCDPRSHCKKCSVENWGQCINGSCMTGYTYSSKTGICHKSQ